MIKQEILTYEKKDGKIWITTETRNYQGDDDYIDSWESECMEVVEMSDLPTKEQLLKDPI